jgi:vancomycin resistance protein YoaR
MPKRVITNLNLIGRIEAKYLVMLGVLVAVLALVNITALTIAIKYEGRTFPGLMLAGQMVGGLTREQLIEKLNQRGKKLADSNLTIIAGGDLIEVKIGNIAKVDAEKSSDEAINVGRRGSVIDVWRDRIKALLRQEDVPAVVALDKEQLSLLIGEVRNKADVPVSEAKIEIKGGKAIITPERVGEKANEQNFTNKLASDLARFDVSKITVVMSEITPKIVSADLTTAKEETDNALKSPVILNWNDKSWIIDGSKIANLLSFSATDQALARAQIGDSSLTVGRVRKLSTGKEPTGNLELHLSYDSGKLGSILDPIVNSINQPATDPRLAFVDGKLQVATGSGEGRQVDSELLATKVMASLNGQGPKTIGIPVKVSQSGIDIAHLESLGIKELIGKGQSFYSGSIPGRNKNIAVAAAKVNGALIAPGQVFSLYKQIGEVTPQAGYVTSYVIIGHRTELGLGGGVCQVSTTLFRAALNSGLPIVERHPHAYRVHYYEQNSGPGLDATVFFPSVDFKFRNDTGHYILIQTVNDPAHASLAFEFYGTSDGRASNISTPVVTNVAPAPAPLYQDDPSLAKGSIKQVDWAVEGADASFTRTVTRGGQVILNDTYYSKYSPWQAVYMVGTRG